MMTQNQKRWTLIIITLAVFVAVLMHSCIKDEYAKEAGLKNRKKIDTSVSAVDNTERLIKLQVIRIDGGYTYFEGVRYLTPTPETIKQCIREVLKEERINQKED